MAGETVTFRLKRGADVRLPGPGRGTWSAPDAVPPVGFGKVLSLSIDRGGTHWARVQYWDLQGRVIENTFAEAELVGCDDDGRIGAERDQSIGGSV